MAASESTLAPLRRRERQRRIAALRQRQRDTLGPNACSVWLYSCGEAFGYGSLARGDWDGFSDTDLLVVAANQDAAEWAARVQERCHPSQSHTRGLDGADQCVVTARRPRLMSEGG